MGVTMKYERVRIGMIGCGGISGVMYLPHTNRTVAGCQVDLVATADIVEEKAVQAMDRFGAKRAYADYRDLLADDEVDAVVIATTIATHAGIALDAAKAGKHILLQKPIAESLEEADAVIAAAKASGVKLQVEPAHMLNPFAIRARRTIASGALGKIGLVQARSAHRGVDNRAWFYQREFGGSVMLDMGVHALTWVVSMVGPARAVTAFAKTALPKRAINGVEIDVDIEDNVAVLLDFGDGLLGNVISNYLSVADASPGYSIYGSEGTIHVNAFPNPTQPAYMQLSRKEEGEHGWHIPTVPGIREMPLPFQTMQVGRETPLYSSMGHFIQCLAEDREPIPSPEVARHVLEIMDKALVAARTGQTQKLETTFTLAEWA
jgi:predicted dehydrogenase